MNREQLNTELNSLLNFYVSLRCAHEQKIRTPNIDELSDLIYEMGGTYEVVYGNGEKIELKINYGGFKLTFINSSLVLGDAPSKYEKLPDSDHYKLVLAE